MTPTAALLEEIRLLRRMGDGGRAAAAAALKSARLGEARLGGAGPGAARRGAARQGEAWQGEARDGAAASTPDDPMKYLTHSLDAAVVDRGGGSIFATKARGELSPEAEARIEAWALETPRIHPDTTGVKPKDRPEGKR